MYYYFRSGEGTADAEVRIAQDFASTGGFIVLWGV